MEKIWIIIVTYNGMQWLQKCLKSTKPYSVIVVDNNSNDDTINYIKNNYPEIILLQQEKNLGFGQANNIGISYAQKEGADYVFLLNQDAYLFPKTIKNLIILQQQNLQYGILSPIHINNEESKLDANFSDYISFCKNPNFVSDLVLKRSVQDVYSVPFINAAAWLISRKCLEVVGGFDPLFFHYGEDDNYCQRLRFHKFKVGIVPNEFVIHDRENRQKEPLLPYSSQYLTSKERSLKIKYANINVESINGLKDSEKKSMKSLIKNLFLGRYRMAKYFFEELQMIRRIIPEIETSRRQNKFEIGNYLK